MTPQDPRLSEVLRKWKDVKPRTGFESRVLARIRAADDSATEPWWLWLRDVLPLRFYAAALAALAGIAVGISAATLSRSGTAGPRPTEFAVAGPGTLSGQYLAALSGGNR